MTRFGGECTREDGPISARTLFPYIRTRGSAGAIVPGRHPRGRYEFGPLRLWTRFPFGMIRGETVIQEPQTLLVLPRSGRLTPPLAAIAAIGGSRHQQRATPAGPAGRGFLRPAQLALGDSRRWIHWRRARRQTPVVRQFEQQRNQDLALVLELWQPERPSEADLANVEIAVSFAASIVSDLCRRGGRTLWMAVAARSRMEQRADFTGADA